MDSTLSPINTPLGEYYTRYFARDEQTEHSTAVSADEGHQL